MPSEKGGDDSAAPKRTGHEFEREKKQQSVSGVQQHIRQVMRARFHPEELHVQHMRQPRERMPVAGVAAGKGPLHILPAQTILNLRVGRDVGRVVEMNELRVKERPENGESGSGENEAN